jgi:hypothetical protein
MSYGLFIPWDAAEDSIRCINGVIQYTPSQAEFSIPSADVPVCEAYCFSQTSYPTAVPTSYPTRGLPSTLQYITKTYDGYSSFTSSILGVCYKVPRFMMYFLIYDVTVNGNEVTLVQSDYSDSTCSTLMYSGNVEVLPLECNPNSQCNKFVFSDAPLVPAYRPYYTVK